jgi:tetraacyldisaccharide 4'-kinase
LSLLLLPLAGLYCLVMGLRRAAYARGWLASVRAPVPVVVVGNITVGGTGKTPLVIWLAQLLRQHGYRPGIVTRGYRGQQRVWPARVHPDADPRLFGDEPVLLARHGGCSVVAGPDRVAAAAVLWREEGCDVILSDDGLQHYRLARDVEIAVVDGVRRYGNGHCLPAGPLREPVRRLGGVFVQVANGEPRGDELGMRLEALALHNLADGATRPVTSLQGQGPVHALAGIGNPTRFFQQLRRLGYDVIEHPYPDHHHYVARDLAFADAAPVIMTEKDAVKCRAYARANHWYLSVEARPDARLAPLLLSRLEELRRGQKTA